MKYMGIDIGDGESAAAVLDDHAADTTTPRIPSLGAFTSLLSVVGDKDGKIVVGDDVKTDTEVKNVQDRFKSRFLSDRGSSSTAVIRFAMGLRALLYSEFQYGDVTIALGCPAGWSAEDRQAYTNLVGNAGFGFQNLHPVAESRAAFLYARYDQQVGLSPEELSQPVLVIDIGSSTTDFAYIVNGKETNVGVFGANHLGGGQLDELILEDAVANSPNEKNIRAVFDGYPAWKNRCDLEAREAKEHYFKNEKTFVQMPYLKTCTIWADVNAPLSLTFSLNAEKMQRLLNAPLDGGGSESFLERLRSYLQTAQKQTQQNPPQQIILTGGASRMAFFREECKKAFPNAKFTICPEPEYSIARGLSIAARIDYRLDQFRKQVDAFFQEGSLNREIANHIDFLINDLVPILTDRVMKCCVDPVRNQKGLTKEARRQQFQTLLKSQVEDQPITPQASSAVTTWIEKYLTESQKNLDKICDENGVDKADMRLATLRIPLKLNGLTINLSHHGAVMAKILNFIWSVLPVLNSPRQDVKNAIKQEMTMDSFAHKLCSGLEAELRAQIQESIEKVEVKIV